MKLQFLAILFSAGAMNLAGQTSSDIQTLKQQLQEANQRLEKLVQEQRQLIDNLSGRLQQLEKDSTNRPPPVASAIPPAQNVPVRQEPWSPTAPLRVMGNARNYINLSFDALFAAGYSTAEDVESLQLGGHDPKQRGFTVQNLETVFEGHVDPYFRAQASLVYQIDPNGESTFEAEEAYLETMALPGNLQVKGGQFFTEFGRLNPTHPHTWDFVDQPLVNGRLFGEDGLRNPGVRVSWLAPTPFYSELFFTVQNSQGETASSFRNDHEGEPYLGRLHEVGRVKGFGDLLFTPRYAASFDLTPNQTLLGGVSAAFGPNASGASADTRIYGIDLFWKWKPSDQHGGFPFVSVQTEGMVRRYEAGRFNWDLNSNGLLDPGEQDLNGDLAPDALPREALLDYGVYSQVSWGFKKGWVAGFRGDWVSSQRADYERQLGRDIERATRWRLSPDLTYYPSEFSKLRLQYNLDNRGGLGADHSVWLQAEFLLGAHAAHKF